MKTRSRYCLFMIVLMVSSLVYVGHAQSRYDSAYVEMARQRPEKLLVFTDRDLYAVNESILFSAFLQSGADPYTEPGSRVLYIDLLNSGGETVVQNKFLITENTSSGHVSIPPGIVSGNYFLRSYTRWMRNFGARDFSYIPIRVVNPFSKDEQAANPETEKPYLKPAPKDPPSIAISTVSQSYAAGELIEVTIAMEDGNSKDVQHACITVVPLGSIDTSALIHRVDVKPDLPAPFQFNFLPDRNGTAISGTIYKQNSLNPAADIPVHFSILGEHPAYYVTRSDQRGSFLLNLPPLSGNQEMFVVPEQDTDHPLDVRIENDFSTEPLPFQTGGFRLRQDEKQLASRISLHMQLQMAYLAKSGTDSVNITEPSESIPFYGLAPINVKIDEFINLPNMEEVIENLVPRTAVMRRKGRAFFTINSENPMISSFPPLLLIDQIPVFDPEVILSIPPSKIEHVEVIPEVYVRGSMKYGGILSFYSRNRDLAGIKLPEGSYFFDFTTLQPAMIPDHPRYTGNATIPDTRNTLFWKNRMELRGHLSTKISFPAASVPGTYLILLRGVSTDGRIVHGHKLIKVK